jgi:hypothetical protein
MNEYEIGEACGTIRKEINACKFWWRIRKKRSHLQELQPNIEYNIKMDHNQYDGRAWNGYIWIKLGTIGGLFRRWN